VNRGHESTNSVMGSKREYARNVCAYSHSAAMTMPHALGDTSYVARLGWIGATRQRIYATNVAIASSTAVMTAELTSPRAT